MGVRWLGSGEICSDYAGLLCCPRMPTVLPRRWPAYLTGPQCAPGKEHCWDLIEIDGVDGEDGRSAGCCGTSRNAAVRNTRTRQCKPGGLALPSSWEEFLSNGLQGASQKAPPRRSRVVRAPACAVDADRRKLRATWTGLGHAQSICTRSGGKCWASRAAFASEKFGAFHRDVARQLLLAGQLQFQLLELDGRTAAVEYQVLSQGDTYIYQAGIDTERLDEEPGHLITAATIKRAIEQGGRAVDFLRGDEPYKPHFLAEPRQQMALCVVPDRTLSRCATISGSPAAA